MSTLVEEKVAVSFEVRAIMKRYWDAYLVAKIIVGSGKIIKAVGIIGAIILVIVGYLIMGEGRRGGEAAVAAGIVIIVFGIVVGVWSYLFGVIVSAIGEILKAGLDTAVNTSPLLTDYQKAKVMSVAKPDNIRFVVEGSESAK